jgi:hypothetical protein
MDIAVEQLAELFVGKGKQFIPQFGIRNSLKALSPHLPFLGFPLFLYQ